MKKFYPYFILIPIIGFALIPPIPVKIAAPNPHITTWLILIAAFFGFYTLFLKVNPFVKIIAIGVFINCFFSRAPYLSFVAYISVVACCYFYILCTKIENWQPVFKALQVVVFLNLVLILLQQTGNDKLLNFGLKDINCNGTIGGSNQLGGLINTLTALLVSFSPFNFTTPLVVAVITRSMGTFFVGMLGLLVWLYGSKSLKATILVMIILVIFFVVNAKNQGDFNNGSGRIPVWKETIKLANRHPVSGWGTGTYKYIMNAFMPTFRSAHNSALQILFEFGYPGLILVIIAIAVLFYKLIKAKLILCLSGLTIFIADSMLHFPDRQIQVVLIIIAFLAFCERSIYGSPHTS